MAEARWERVVPQSARWTGSCLSTTESESVRQPSPSPAPALSEGEDAEREEGDGLSEEEEEEEGLRERRSSWMQAGIGRERRPRGPRRSRSVVGVCGAGWAGADGRGRGWRAMVGGTLIGAAPMRDRRAGEAQSGRWEAERDGDGE